jgi:hypothetical protein
MFTVLLPPGVNTTAVNKHININNCAHSNTWGIQLAVYRFFSPPMTQARGPHEPFNKISDLINTNDKEKRQN